MPDKKTIVQLAQKGKAVREFQTRYSEAKGKLLFSPTDKDLGEQVLALLIAKDNAEREFDQIIEDITLASEDVEVLPFNQFARLFNFPEGQLLATIDDDDDDPDGYVLICKVVKGQTAVMTKSHFQQHGEAEFALMNITEVRAREKFEGMYRMLSR